jgi:hypothetical protein
MKKCKTSSQHGTQSLGCESSIATLQNYNDENGSINHCIYTITVRFFSMLVEYSQKFRREIITAANACLEYSVAWVIIREENDCIYSIDFSFISKNDLAINSAL